MWTESLIELFASAYAPQGWTGCPTCKMEYSKPILAHACWKAHRRVYDRVYAGIDTEQVKHEVAFDGDRPLCRSCTKRAEIAVTVVHMAEPPACSRCNGVIEDPPVVELVPMGLPASELHRDLLLRPSRAALVAAQDWSVHSAMTRPRPDNSRGIGSPTLDRRLFDEFGPFVNDGKAALPRASGGYVQVKEGQPIPCSLPSS